MRTVLKFSSIDPMAERCASVKAAEGEETKFRFKVGKNNHKMKGLTSSDTGYAQSKHPENGKNYEIKSCFRGQINVLLRSLDMRESMFIFRTDVYLYTYVYISFREPSILHSVCHDFLTAQINLSNLT